MSGIEKGTEDGVGGLVVRYELRAVLLVRYVSGPGADISALDEHPPSLLGDDPWRPGRAGQIAEHFAPAIRSLAASYTRRDVYGIEVGDIGAVVVWDQPLQTEEAAP